MDTFLCFPKICFSEHLLIRQTIPNAYRTIKFFLLIKIDTFFRKQMKKKVFGIIIFYSDFGKWEKLILTLQNCPANKRYRLWREKMSYDQGSMSIILFTLVKIAKNNLNLK